MAVELSEHTRRNVAGILHYLTQYLNLRFDYACRINPDLLGVRQELSWHQLETMRHILSGDKPIGEKRIVVADELISFHAAVKRDIFSPTNQISILAETLEAAAEDSGRGKTIAFSIRDVRGLYTYTNAKLATTMDLIQTWLWWDLPDACDRFLFDTQVDTVRRLRAIKFDDKVLAYYKNQMPPGEKIAPQSILAFELGRLQSVIQTIENRRVEEKPNAVLIAAEEEEEADGADALILQLAQHIKAASRLEESGHVDPSLVEYYQKALACASDQVTPDRVLAFESDFIKRAKREAADSILSGGRRRYYDYKKRELDRLKETLAAVRQEFARKPAEAAASA
jgi:hypothetical protein